MLGLAKELADSTARERATEVRSHRRASCFASAEPKNFSSTTMADANEAAHRQAATGVNSAHSSPAKAVKVDADVLSQFDALSKAACLKTTPDQQPKAMSMTTTPGDPVRDVSKMIVQAKKYVCR